jgi:AcrR family transcriptional regulator
MSRSIDNDRNVVKRSQTRELLLRAAARGFRELGYGGAGIDALAKGAGVTSGAVYDHFGSKARLFREALASGLDEFRNGVAGFRAGKGTRWIGPFAQWYLSKERRNNLPESCALATLTLDAARADDETKEVYESELRGLIAEFADGLGGRKHESEAIAILALLAGGLSIGHAVADTKLGNRIARAIAAAATILAEDGGNDT